MKQIPVSNSFAAYSLQIHQVTLGWQDTYCVARVFMVSCAVANVNLCIKTLFMNDLLTCNPSLFIQAAQLLQKCAAEHVKHAAKRSSSPSMA